MGKTLLNILSLVCGLISAIATFLAWVYLGGLLNRLTHEKFSGFWNVSVFVAGLISGLVVSGIVRNLIYKEPTRFK